MIRLRAAKVAGIAKDIPLVEVDDPGGRRPARGGLGLHLRDDPGRPAAGPGPRLPGRPRPSAHLNPFPIEPRRRGARYPKVLVPEMNLGQLVELLRADFLVDAQSLTNVEGSPSRLQRSSGPSST